MNKFSNILELTQKTIEKISQNGETWMNYLNTASRLYKYSFQDQLLIYAQKPDATACATMQQWNKKMGCWVNKGSTGIALIDTDNPSNPKLKYVFDISDVHAHPAYGKYPFLWTLDKEKEVEVFNNLFKDFNMKKDNIEICPSQILDFSKSIVEDQDRYKDILNDLISTKDESYLEEIDDINIDMMFRETLTSSIAYCILSRCGYDTEIYNNQMNFDYIHNFNTVPVMSYLGSATSNIAKPILMQIGKIIRYEIQQKRGIENANYIQSTRTIQDTEFSHGTNEYKKIWANESNLPQGEKTRTIHNIIVDREITKSFDRNRKNSNRTNDNYNRTNDETRRSNRNSKISRPDAMGTKNEQYSEFSRGSYSNGDYLQLTLFANEQQQKDAIEIGVSKTPIFITENDDKTPIYSYINPKSEKNIPHDYIKQVLKQGNIVEGGKSRIKKIYETEVDTHIRIKELKNEYGIGGYHHPLDEYGVCGYDFDGKGIQIFWKDKEGKKEGSISWSRVEKEIATLIFNKEYDTEDNVKSREFNTKDIKVAIKDNNESLTKEKVKLFEKTPNYVIQYESYDNKGQRYNYNCNIAAINTLFNIEKDKRYATKEEQEILSKYIGWGGLSQVFDETNQSWKKEHNQLKNLLNEKEYSKARASTLNAHYTQPFIIKSIYDALRNMGFKEGNILDPAMGTGRFFGMLPNDMKNSKLYGIELDNITGRIAKQLYQNANIKVNGYENSCLEKQFFDVAIGNVPFGSYKVNDSNYDKENFLIHDYFFAKTLDVVRPGGVIAFITSKGTLDKKNPKVRKYIANRANLIGAIRLPNDAFINANTQVTSDIIFLQKIDKSPINTPNWVYVNQNDVGIEMNEYFIENPDMILGKMEVVSGPYGPDITCTPTSIQLDVLLSEAIKKIETTIHERKAIPKSSNDIESIPAEPNIPNYSYAIINDKIYYREYSIMRQVNTSESEEKRIKGLIALRDCTRELIKLQLEEYTDAEITFQQKRLNKIYDNFVEKNGLINSRANKRIFREDPSYCLLCSLEILNEDGSLKEKAAMFTKRTIKSQTKNVKINTPLEALGRSLGTKAKVDLNYMEDILENKFDKEKIIQELKGIIFQNPITKEWETNDEYLSGDIRTKLDIAKQITENDTAYQINVEYLTKVLPKELTASEIDIRLGATWIDTSYIDDFMKEIIKTPQYMLSDKKIAALYSNITGTWNIKGKSSYRSNITANITYGTKRINAYKILEESLNLRDVKIFDTITNENGKEERILNKKETLLAQEKQALLKQAFQDWIFKTPERREILCKKYNTLFNSIRPRNYDGSHIEFVGMNPEISLRKHQLNAVARIIYGKNTLLAHCVGAGKTYEMIAAAMESKRLGLSQKALFVVPNHLTEQWASEYLTLYPGANILAATKKDFEPANRKKFCGRIATGNYDAVIIGHTQFEKIPLSMKRQINIIDKQISDITKAINDAKENNGEKYSIKQLERTKKNLETKLLKLNSNEKKDIGVITFEELGVDRLYVDEAHNYKNLFLYTKMRNVAGISQTEAQKSSDMFAKCRYIDELTKGRGIIFATGTPISNSMTELYTMMRYLQYSTLEKLNLSHFDAWASTFGETTTAIELSPEGTGYRAKTRFSKFYNLPELLSIFKECADIQTPDMLKLPVPEVEYHDIVIKANEIQKEIVESLAKRAEKVRNRNVEPFVDNMLNITNDGRKLALDQRIISPLYPDDDSSKLNSCVNNVVNIWEKGKNNKTTQLVFCDLSTPKYDGNFNVYEDIKSKLIAKDVPENEIAFIHDAKTEIQKANLFSQVRKGNVRILMGSTSKMGAGTNVQNKLIALHHLDVPWKPSDIEQQEGRILRQGNTNEKVNIFRYVTEGTFDAYSWQLIENKQKFISQIMTSKSPVRSCEDIDESVLSYAEVKALATGNPYIKEKMDLDIQVAKLQMLKANYISQQYNLEDNVIKLFPQKIKQAEDMIIHIKKDIEHLSSNKTDEFSITIDNNVYYDKKESGAKIIEMCKELGYIQSSKNIGKYNGFNLKLSMNEFSKSYTLSIENALSYTIDVGLDELGNITRINNCLDNLHRHLEKAHLQYNELQEQHKNAKSELGKPFEYEKELFEKTSRLNELNMLLDQDNKSNEISINKQDIIKDLKYHNFKPSQQLVSEITELSTELGKLQSLKDIKNLTINEQGLTSGQQELVEKITKILKGQELEAVYEHSI